MITLELPNFGHMTTFTVWFESRDKILLVASWAESMTSKPLYQNTFILRRPMVANFAEIVKNLIMFIKKAFKGSKKLKKLDDFRWKKCWCQQRSSGVSRDLYIFWIFSGQGVTVPSAIIARYVRHTLGRVPFLSPQSMRSPKKKAHRQ